MVRVHGAPLEAGTFVNPDSTLVEGGHGEHEALWGEAFPRELEAGGEVLYPETLPGEIRPQAKPDIDGLVLALELEETDEGSFSVEGREVGAFSAFAVQQFFQIVGVARPVVEVVGRLIVPARDLTRVLVGHLPEPVSGHYPSDSSVLIRSRIASWFGSLASSTTLPSER